MRKKEISQWVNYLTFRLLIIIMVGAWVWVFLQRQPEEPEYKIKRFERPSEQQPERRVYTV